MNFKEIQVVVMSSGAPVNRLLGLWLMKHQLDYCYGSPENLAGVDVARNQTITRFLREDVPKGKKYLLGFDHDMIPLESTRHILTEPGELIYCGYAGRHGSKGHYGNDDFGMSCFRTSVDVLVRMQYPWCQNTMLNGAKINCECNFFHQKVLGLGIKPKMVGIIGHEQTCILIPSKTELGWSLLWSEDIKL
jgi:hypothetical protein